MLFSSVVALYDNANTKSPLSDQQGPMPSLMDLAAADASIDHPDGPALAQLAAHRAIEAMGFTLV